MRIILILLTTILFSCKSSKDSVKKEPLVGIQAKNIEFTIIKEGTNSGFTTSKNWKIETQSDFLKAWNSIFANYMQKDPLPKIDFETNTVFVITMGGQRSGGYTIGVKSILETKKEIIINIKESKPGGSCMTTSVLTYPYQLFTIPKTNKPIIYNRIEKIYECEK